MYRPDFGDEGPHCGEVTMYVGQTFLPSLTTSPWKIRK
jgi:hypothetical protein